MKAATPPLQALVFDVDKTLTTRQKEFTSRTRNALAQLVAQGQYTLALCTGRSRAQAASILEVFPSESLHVFNGGGMIAAPQGPPWEEQSIPSEIVKEIAMRCEELGGEFEIDHNGEVGVSQRKLAQSPHFVDARQWSDWSTSLICLQWINDDIRSLVQEYQGFTIKEMLSEVNGPYLDITLAGINKGSGLRRWSQLTGIPLEKVAGVGDSENDLEFLSVVGWPVAMGNAVPEVKAVAQEVIGDCDEDGLAQYIEERFLV